MEVEIGRGKKGRRAYGFDDIAIVPSRRTRDPDDIDITWTLGPYRFELPLLASAMDGVVSPDVAAELGKLGGLASAQPRGDLDPLRGRRRAARADRLLRQGARHHRDAAHLRRAGARGPDRAADQRDQGAGRGGGGVADAPARAQLLRDRDRGGARHPGHPGDRDLGGARVDAQRAAQPEGVHPRGAGAGRGRRVRLVRDRAAPDADRRGRRAGGRRPGRRLHHARGAGDRGAAGDGDRRRGGRPLAAHARDRRVREGDRRRRDAQRRGRLEGVRVRRRRRDDRLAAGTGLRGAGARLPLGNGDVPSLAAARRAREDDAERDARADPAGPRPRERRHVQPDGEPAHVDGDDRLRGHPGVPQGRGDGRPGAAERGQAAAARAGGRHGSDLGGGAPPRSRRRTRKQRRARPAIPRWSSKALGEHQGGSGSGVLAGAGGCHR